jgi:hypothetical protein
MLYVAIQRHFSGMENFTIANLNALKEIVIWYDGSRMSVPFRFSVIGRCIFEPLLQSLL